MHKSKLKRISLAVCLAIMPWAADAAGLGKLTVASGLGEPLSAEIELIGTTQDELESLSAAIAPEAAYAVQGVERTPIQNAIQVNVSRKANGTSVLRLTSNQPITDPFVDMLIQVEWATGRLVREYTMLLDPPGYASPIKNALPQAAAPAIKPPAAQPATPAPSATAAGAVQPVPDVQKAPADAAAPATKRNERKPAAPAAEKPKPAESDASSRTPDSRTPGSQTHGTVRGDTLSAIARNADTEGVSLEQMLVGIYRANKDAFVDNNMNRLKVGQILRIPPPQEVEGISNQEAKREVQLQAADWNAYRKRLGESVAASAASREGAESQSANGKLTPAAQDKAAQKQAGPRDVVRLSKGESADNAAARSAQEKLAAMNEEAIAKQKALQEANERTADLEKQVQDMQKLLAIKNQAMAALKENADAQLKDKAAAPAPAEPAAKAQPEASSAPAEAAKSSNAADGVVKPEENANPAKPTPVKPATPATTPATVPDAELIEGIDNEKLMLWGGAAGALLLLLGGWLFLRNKRKRNLDTFEKAILTSSGLKANTVFGSTLNSKVDSGDTSFLTDFSQTGGGMIDTHDVDPIAEAEVYMAYGRDAQAEEILRDAIAKDPKRYELHHKLLEMYAARKDTAAFETLAGEIYATTGSSDPQWSKVAELGRKLDSQNPIYQGNDDGLGLDDDLGDSPAANSSESGRSMDFSLDDAGESDFSAPESSDEASSELDFGLGDTESAETQPEENNTLDFAGLDVDFGMPDTPNEGNRAADASIAAAMLAPTIMEQAAEGDGKQTANQKAAPADEAAPGFDDLDFQLDLPESPAASTIQMDISDFANTISGVPEDKDSEVAELPEDQLSSLDLNLPAQGSNAEAEAEGFPSLDFAPTTFDSSSSESDATANLATEQAQDLAFGASTPASEAAADGMAASPFGDLPNGNKDSDPFIAGDAESAVDTPAPISPVALNEDPIEEIVFESPAGGDVDLDFNVDSLSDANKEEALPDFNPAPTETITPAEVDFSDINLDLEGASAADALSGDGAAESAEVDTKLDLVTAYMDMGDNEGARELLEEVMSEGGPQQRARAQAIMNGLGSS